MWVTYTQVTGDISTNSEGNHKPANAPKNATLFTVLALSGDFSIIFLNISFYFYAMCNMRTMSIIYK